MYQIIDRLTSEVVAQYNDARTAIRMLHRYDNAYGAYRYYKKLKEVSKRVAYEYIKQD